MVTENHRQYEPLRIYIRHRWSISTIHPTLNIINFSNQNNKNIEASQDWCPKTNR